MSTPATKREILVGVDGSPESKVAVDWAARDAALRGLPVRLVHVLNPPVVMTFPEVPMPSGYLQWQEESGREILDSACKTVAEATKDHPVEVTTEMVSGPAVPTLVEPVQGCTAGRGRLPRSRCAGPRSARFGQHRVGPSRALPGGDHPRRGSADVAPVEGPGGRRCRRVAGIGAGAGDRLRAGLVPRGGSGGGARLERHRGVRVPGCRLVDDAVDRRGDAFRAAGRLAGALSRCPGAPGGRRRPAGPPAHRAVGVGPAGGGRQPRPRRVRRDAAWLGQHRGGPRRADAGDRRATEAGTIRAAVRSSAGGCRRRGRRSR